MKENSFQNGKRSRRGWFGNMKAIGQGLRAESFEETKGYTVSWEMKFNGYKKQREKNSQNENPLEQHKNISLRYIQSLHGFIKIQFYWVVTFITKNL